MIDGIIGLIVGKYTIYKQCELYRDKLRSESMNQVKETIIGFLIGIGIYAVLIELVGFFFSENFFSSAL